MLNKAARSYDPLISRNSFVRNSGFMLRYLEQDAFDASAPMGNIARSRLQMAVECWVAGLQPETTSVISNANKWLDFAIEKGEQFGESQNFYRMQMHSARAMSAWLGRGTVAREDWAEALKAELAAWSEGPSTDASSVGTQGLDDCMAFCVQSGDYEQGTHIYEKLLGVKPVSLRGTLAPRRLGYAICLHHAQGQFDEDALFDAGRRMLQVNLSGAWLAVGQTLRAAMWLKIVYWDRDTRAGRVPGLTPLQTVLKAYENMPGVAVPDFIDLTIQ